MKKFSPLIAAALLAAAPLAAAPARSPAAEPVPAARGAPVERMPDVPGIVLLGMAVSGLLIVGIAARRRQPGRSVTS